MERVEGLAAFEGPGTERYIGLRARDGARGSRTAAGTAAKLAELERRRRRAARPPCGARPMFERELAKRAAALDGAPADAHVAAPGRVSAGA